ncbi:MAG: 5-oxoprolinase subunit PxpB [Blautia sp.]|nr:5-oxoprolinase subunit PxpB [Blautia sp.]
MELDIRPVGDSALTIVFGNRIAPEINEAVARARRYLKERGVWGVTEYVQTYASLMVHYDPFRIRYEELVFLLQEALAEMEGEEKEGQGKTLLIPVCYGGEYGPDLDFVCQHTGLSREEVISRHSSETYRIYMLGFLPGFVYLGGMDPSLSTPRLKSPRKEVPMGAVGIAGGQTGVYPMASPGGWQLIGRTPLRLYDPQREEAILYEPGDFIRFVAINEEEFLLVQQQVDNGTYTYDLVREGE